jgi:hypothetical protein
MSDTPHTRTSRAARRLLYGAVGAALLSIPTLAVADEVFTLTQNVPITGLASFDISYVDPSIHTYLLADRSNSEVAVIDTGTKALSAIGVGDFAGVQACSQPNACNGPNGVLTVHQGNGHDHFGDNRGAVEVWAGDAPHGCSATACGSPTNPSTIKVFSFPGGTLLHTISTGGVFRADEGCWDQEDHLVLFANDAELPSPFISFISTDTYTVVGKIVMDGGSGAGHGPNATNGIEQCKYNAREHAFYINLPEVNGSGADTAPGETLVIDPHNFKIKQTFVIPIADCAGPQGMAIGPAPQIALGCNAKTIPGGVRNSVVINEEDGSVIAVLANEGGTDENWFNPGDGHYFFANSTPGSTAPLTPQLLGVVDSRGDTLDASVVTQAASTVGAHSVAADPVLNQAYVPVAGGVNIYSSNGPDDVAFVHRHHDDH